MEVEITRSSPAAVDSAAARPPAATRATTQLGNPAISGFARTMMSRSMVSSFAVSLCGPRYWTAPSPLWSSHFTRPVSSQLVNQVGTSS